MKKAVFACLLLLVALAHAEDHPLARAKVGEWVLQKNVISGSMTLGVYTWISKVDGRKVTVMTQPLNADLKTPSAAATESKVDLDRIEKAKEAPKISEEDLDVKGKKLRCKKTETTTETQLGKTTTVTWTSSEIPIYGIVRQIVKDKEGKELLRSELVDYGTDGGKAKDVPKSEKK